MRESGVVVVGEKLEPRRDDPVLWCLHCGRVSFQSEWVRRRNGRPLRACPYPGCDGLFGGDAFDWAAQRTCHGTEPPRADMPEVPVRGVFYEVA